jgi:two-component system NarL family sensor kinase
MPISKSEAIAVFCFIILFILVVVSFIIVILFFIKKKQKEFTLNMIAVKANHEMELFKTKLEIQEQISQEISMEIHDNVGQSISIAKMILNTLDTHENYETKEGINETSELLGIALDNLRYIGRKLNSEIVKKGGLIKSIELQAGYLRRGGKLDAQLHVNGEPVTLHETKEVFLFRIVQEAVNNIVKHANATAISICLSYSKNVLKLQIEDNGKGFNLTDQVSGLNHIGGIYNMQNRAKQIGAEINIESTIGNGTTIIVTTPF